MVTPVRQEKEFYEPLILKLCQEEAPYLLIINIKLGYIKAQTISSLVHQVPLGVYSFNYTDYTDQYDPNSMNDVLLSTKSLYFPFIDIFFVLSKTWWFLLILQQIFRTSFLLSILKESSI